MSDLVVVSNRGPVAVTIGADGAVNADKASGGLAPSLARALSGTGALWIASTMNAVERHAVEAGHGSSLVEGIELDLVAMPDELRHEAYNVIANSTLWYLHHGMFDAIRTPVFDRAWHRAWSSYQAFNEIIASEVAERAPKDATILVHDYHLALVGSFLSEERPDLKTVHFTHTPFATPAELAALPSSVVGQLLEGLSAFGACGFHTKRWADNFRACIEGAGIVGPHVFHAPLGSDAVELQEAAAESSVKTRRDELGEIVAGRQLILRSDRIEPSKNIVRGFLAFEELLENAPEFRDRVLLMARAYPSRTDLADYVGYRSEVERVVERINERFSVGGRSPVLLEVLDDFSASLAAFGCYDVLLVNPIRDGMNLVAKEGAVLNDRHGVLALSTEAGAFAELGEAALAVEPFDVSGTAAQLQRALLMAGDEREQRSRTLSALAAANPPSRWLASLIQEARQPKS